MTDKVLKLVMVTIFWLILTSVGHCLYINFLENKTILVTELSPKQYAMIKLGLWQGVFKIIGVFMCYVELSQVELKVVSVKI